MSTLIVVLLLLLGVALLTPLADRFSVPGPVACTLFGIVLAVIPGVPPILIEPELVLPLLLPPLLFAAAHRSSSRDFTENIRSLLALAVGLVVVTTVVVALVARWVDPGLPIAAAIALGALVSPPDPVAATAVAGRLGLPKRLVNVLEGEGLLNDATAIVLYTVAVSAAMTGTFSVADGAHILGVSVVLAPLIGVAAGWLGRRLIGALSDPRAEVTLTLLLPYAAFLLVEELGGSGVLAVVAAGLTLGQRGGTAFSGAGFLARTTVWQLLDWLIGGLAFGLIGFELVTVLASPEIPTYGAGVAAAVCAVAVGVRALFVFPLGAVVRRRLRRSGAEHTWRESTVVAWAGMRGVVTLATALALPEDFPGRPVVVLAALCVVLVTLIGQGLTLPWLVRALGVRAEENDNDHQKEHQAVRRRSAVAALRRLDELNAEGKVDEETNRSLRGRYEQLIAELDPDRPGDDDDGRSARAAGDAFDVAGELRDAERSAALDLRRSGDAGSAAVNRVLRDIAARGLRDADRRELRTGEKQS